MVLTNKGFGLVDMLLATATLSLLLLSASGFIKMMSQSLATATQFNDTLMAGQSIFETALAGEPIPSHPNLKITQVDPSTTYLTFSVSKMQKLELLLVN